MKNFIYLLCRKKWELGVLLKKIQQVDGELFPFLNLNILQDRLGWSIKLRWLAIAGYFLATLIAKSIIRFEIPYQFIWLTLLLLLVINIFYFLFQRFFRNISFRTELTILGIHIIIDLFFLSLLLHFSGGIENPIYFFYLFHVVLSSIVFPKKYPYLFSTIVVLQFALLLFAEYFQVLPHYSIFGTRLHLSLPAIGLTTTVFIVTVYVTTYICVNFMEIYRHSKYVIDKQNKELKKATEQKLQFFRYASHELKSPLVAIKSTIDSVMVNFGKDLNPVSLDLLKRASNRAEQMLMIIKDLLELSRPRDMEKRKSAPKVNVNFLLDELIAQEGALAAEKQISLILDVSFDDLILAMPKEDLEKVLRNLINNAIRYTPKDGTVTVKAYLEKNWLVISVQDTGIGIENKDIANIFNEFYRAENAKKMVSMGTGLGLSLVKKIVEEYNGKIEVQSKINEGSIFTVRFPLTNNKRD